jgi:fibronectin-binding autotransporter adhesin
MKPPSLNLSIVRNHCGPLLLIGSFLVSVLLPATAPGAAISWINPGAGSFADVSNWSPNQVPGSMDIALIANGGTANLDDFGVYSVSNLFVAKAANATGTLNISAGILSLIGAPGVANSPQAGIGNNALGRIVVESAGTLERGTGWLLIGGGGGRGNLVVSNLGTAFLNQFRAGSDNNANTPPGTGHLDIHDGTVIVTNQVIIGRDFDTGIVNIHSGGAFVNYASAFFNGTDSDAFLTIAGSGANAGGTGVVDVATGGILEAAGGIRIASAAAGSVAEGTLRLNGGTLVLQRIFQGSTAGASIGLVELNGGTVRATSATNLNGFVYGDLTVRVKSGGVVIDSAGFDLSVHPALLADASSPGGGVTKIGDGTLRLLGTNTYTGATAIDGGKLLLASASSGGGAISVNDGAGFAVRLSSAGSSLNVSVLTLNTGSGSHDLDFDVSFFGNPTAPVINATTLSANRTSFINLRGAGLSVGEFTLIRFGSAPGLTADHFILGSVPPGVFAEPIITSNSLNLRINGAPALHWAGTASSDWDTTTFNWLDVSSDPPASVTYADDSAVFFGDDASTGSINLPFVVRPAAMTVSNVALVYTLSGFGGSIAGATGLRKQGSGPLTVATPNDYSGDTIISAGVLFLGASGVIPQGASRGNVVVDGTLDLNGFNEGINGLSGSGIIDNSGVVTSTLTFGNTGASGHFSGTLNNTGGGAINLTKVNSGAIAFSGDLTHFGAVTVSGGTLILSGNNSYAGGTTISGGTLQAGSDTALGTGTLTLNGGTLSSDGPAARTVANPVVFAVSSSVGHSVANGPLTFTSAFDMNGASRNLTVNSGVLLSGGSGNGGINKLGSATLTLRAVHNWTTVSEVRAGTLVLDGASVSSTDAVRPDCNVAGGVARLVLGPGSSLELLGATANFRTGFDGDTTATNIIDIAGTVRLPNAAAPDARLLLGGGNTIGFVNLLANGLAVVNSVQKAGTGNYCEFSFDGGTLQATADNPSFMQDLSNAFIRAGGATINSAGFSIAVAQALLDGGGNGGLTKIAPGILLLDGTNTYLGATTVIEGTLGGNGSIAGPVIVQSGATLAPGASIGTLTINNTLQLLGHTVMEVSRDSGAPTSDLLTGMTSVHYGGILVVSNAGAAPLASGDIFDLFNASSFNGAFSDIQLPPLNAGLSWDTSRLSVDGSISVTGTEQRPRFNPPLLSGSDLVLSGSAGMPNSTFNVLSSSNMAVPVMEWVSVASGTFDANGNFTLSIPVEVSAPARFFVLRFP